MVAGHTVPSLFSSLLETRRVMKNSSEIAAALLRDTELPLRERGMVDILTYDDHLPAGGVHCGALSESYPASELGRRSSKFNFVSTVGLQKRLRRVIATTLSTTISPEKQGLTVINKEPIVLVFKSLCDQEVLGKCISLGLKPRGRRFESSRPDQ
jgi:hypothetical protein